MMIECIGAAFTYRWPGGEIHLTPGKPLDLPDDRARRLLAKAPDRVRVLPGPIQAGDVISWQRTDGSVHNGVVDFLHRDTDGQCWGFVSFQNGGWAAVSLARVVEKST